MKKIGILLLMVVLLVTGCGKTDKTSVINDFKSKVNKSKSYELTGTMEIINDEDVFKYNIETKYLHKDIEYYKVRLVNQTNNHEQVILKNQDGVYVVSPSINKSFKFQSNWPNNSSQSYLLASIVADMTNDNTASFEEKDGIYIIKNKVNYPNNEELVYEKIYFDKGNNIKKVEVYNNKDMIKIKVEFKNINMRASLDEDEFILDDLVTEQDCNGSCSNKNENNKNNTENIPNNENTQQEQTNDTENKTTTSIQDIIYPLYVPENTSLKSKDVVSTDTGERVILTFAGDTNFVLVEETMNKSAELEIIPVYGDPEIINDSIGALSANSLSWSSNNVNYYLTGTTLDKRDLISIATSMNNVGVVNAEK